MLLMSMSLKLESTSTTKNNDTRVWRAKEIKLHMHIFLLKSNIRLRKRCRNGKIYN